MAKERRGWGLLLPFSRRLSSLLTHSSYLAIQCDWWLASRWGAVLLALGECSRRRVERWFSEGVSGSGIAVFYLSIWAGLQRY